MESAIRLCYSPFPIAPPRRIHGSNGSSFAVANRIHLKFNHANTLHLSHFSTRQQVTHSFRHAYCMLNNRSSMYSENEGSGVTGVSDSGPNCRITGIEPNQTEKHGSVWFCGDNKILRGVTGASLAMACVVGLFSLSSKLNPKYNTAYAVPWPFSNTTKSYEVRDAPILPGSSKDAPTLALPGPKDALESLLEMINIDHSKQSCPKIEKEPDSNTIRALKVHAMGLSKSGKKDEAQKVLENTYIKYKGSSAGFNLGMACIELLIFQDTQNFKTDPAGHAYLIMQGNFEGARDRLHRLLIDQNEFSSDDPKQLLEEYNNTELFYNKSSIPRILLLKAIIHTMLKNKEAANWWEAFITTLIGNE